MYGLYGECFYQVSSSCINGHVLRRKGTSVKKWKRAKITTIENNVFLDYFNVLKLHHLFAEINHLLLPHAITCHLVHISSLKINNILKINKYVSHQQIKLGV